MNSVYTSDVTTADMSSDSPDPQGYIQSKRKKWKQFLLIKCYTAEHGRGSKRNKYPHEQRDTWEDGPCGEHLCLTFTNSLKLNRAKAQKWCKLFFFFFDSTETRPVRSESVRPQLPHHLWAHRSLFSWNTHSFSRAENSELCCSDKRYANRKPGGKELL